MIWATLKLQALTIALLILMSAGPILAQTRGTQPNLASYGIRGKIVAESGPAERVEVTLERAEQQVVAATFSDSLGNFEFRGLPRGNYYVSVKVPSFEDVRESVDFVPGLTTVVVPTIFLNRKAFVTVDAPRDSPIVDVTELDRNYPKEAVKEYENAQEEIRRDNFKKAALHLEAALKIAPDYYNARNSLGTVYQRLERFRDAEKEFEKARELNPRSVQPLINLGSLYIQEAESTTSGSRRLRGRILDEALDVLETAVKLNSRSAMAYYLLGTANYKSAFYEEAETHLKRALDLDRRMAPAHLMLANLYMRQGKWAEAIGRLDAYLAESPKASDRAQVQEIRSKALQNLENSAK